MSKKGWKRYTILSDGITPIAAFETLSLARRCAGTEGPQKGGLRATEKRIFEVAFAQSECNESDVVDAITDASERGTLNVLRVREGVTTTYVAKFANGGSVPCNSVEDAEKVAKAIGTGVDACELVATDVERRYEDLADAFADASIPVVTKGLYTSAQNAVLPDEDGDDDDGDDS